LLASIKFRLHAEVGLGHVVLVEIGVVLPVGLPRVKGVLGDLDPGVALVGVGLVMRFGPMNSWASNAYFLIAQINGVRTTHEGTANAEGALHSPSLRYAVHVWRWIHWVGTCVADEVFAILTFGDAFLQ
jgi:hypothetical protein